MAVAQKHRGPRFQYDRPWMYPAQENAFFCPERYVYIRGATKTGKAQPLDATVWTPYGPKTMADISVGDTVLTADGTSTVTAVFPQGDQPVYRVTFSDGATTECTEDHLWEIHDKKGQKDQPRDPFNPEKRVRRRVSRTRVLPLRDILSISQRSLQRSWIPVAARVEYAAQDVPFDPYLLGVLLGDGGISGDSIRFSSTDDFILDRVRAALSDWYELIHTDRCNYKIRCAVKWERIPRADRLGAILRDLHLAGLRSHEKHLPTEYRYNTVAVRRAVLAGLMDTDGYVDHRGQPWITQTSAVLATHIEELVEGLGGIAQTRTKQPKGGRLAYVTRITVPDASLLFTLPRKREACRMKKKAMKRTFRSIELIGVKPAKCIQIDDLRGLYLTDSFIVTHNTAAGMIWLLENGFAGRDGQNCWWASSVYSTAEIAYRRLKRMLTPYPGAFKANDSKLRIYLPDNGVTIHFKSAENPDNLFGDDVIALVGDEFSRWREAAWIACRTTLTATQGRARLLFNVKGQKNFAWKLAKRAELDPRKNEKTVQLVCWDAVDAGLLTREEVEDARAQLPEAAFNELYLCIPSEDGGNPFGLQHIEACQVKTISTKPPVCFGVDFARSQDFTVVIGLDEDGHECYFDRWQHTPWPETQARIEAATGKKPTLADSTGIGDVMIGYMAPNNPHLYPFMFSLPSKQKLISSLTVDLQRREFRYASQRLRDEFDIFEYVTTPAGVRYTVPEGFHDDAAYAAALARMMWKNLPRDSSLELW